MSKFNEKFIKNYYEDSDIGYILEADAGYPKGFKTLTIIYHFYQK